MTTAQDETSTTDAERDALIASLRAQLAERDRFIAERDQMLAQHKQEYARLQSVYQQLLTEMQLLKRRIFVGTAERVDTTQLQLEFAELTKKLDALAGVLGGAGAREDGEDAAPKPCSKCGSKTGCRCKKRGGHKPTGRRNLNETNLPVDRVEIRDPLFEKLVAEGKAELIGFEDSSKLGYRKGGLVNVVQSLAKYRAVNAQGEAEIETAAVPAEIIARCLAAPSTLAHLLVAKYCDGLPLYRVEQIFERLGFSVDRGTMSRWVHELGQFLGASVIHAAHGEAIREAFCILTDATGFSIQPGPSDDGKRRPCRKGHYFVKIADRDHIFYEFTPRETSANVRAMFRGFEGYLQADAKSVYDVLFEPPDPNDPDDDGCVRTEVGCWAHGRRKFWEAAFAKQPAAQAALVRISKIYELDARFRDGNPPSKIKDLRQAHLAPLVDEFLEFAATEYERVRDQRGPLRKAFGYIVRQRDALRRFLEDGRLRLDNNPSESALRKVVMVRDAALFAGSDEHAESAGHVLSLIASARLHRLDPERYLTDLIRVLPYWPRDRYLELAPKYWAQTRARLLDGELDQQIGPVTVPGPVER